MIDFSALNMVDYAVLSIVLCSTVFAFFRGFVGSFLSLMGWVLAIYLSYLFYPDIKPFIEGKVKNHLVVLVGGHTVLLLVFLIAFGIVNLFVTTALAPLTKGIIDRSMGAAFGIARGAVIVSFIFLIVTTTISVINGNPDEQKADDSTMPSVLTDAQTYKYMVTGRDNIAEIIPDSFYKRLEEAYEDISKRTMDQRLIESVSQKLAKQLPADVKQKIDDQNQDSALTMSDEQLENKRAQDMIEAYKKLKKAGGNDTLTISDDEVKRLEEAIKKRNASVPKNDSPPADDSATPAH